MTYTKRGAANQWLLTVAAGHTCGDCLTWPFRRDNHGYGRLGKNGKAHRVVCELVHGAPPTPKHEAAHSCGKGHLGCVSPSHLEWKTHQDNQRDRLAHGTHIRGERHPLSKLTEADVRRILSLKGEKTQEQIGAEFGITHQQVSRIHKGLDWGWIKDSRQVWARKAA